MRKITISDFPFEKCGQPFNTESVVYLPTEEKGTRENKHYYEQNIDGYEGEGMFPIKLLYDTP
jgi:hypothetical protein